MKNNIIISALCISVEMRYHARSVLGKCMGTVWLFRNIYCMVITNSVMSGLHRAVKQ